MAKMREVLRLPTWNMTAMNRLLARISERLDQVEGFRGSPQFRDNIDMEQHRIRDMADGVDSTDAVTKGQLDTATAGIATGIPTWDPARTYVEDGYVVGGDGYIYRAHTDVVAGQDPTRTPEIWTGPDTLYDVVLNRQQNTVSMDVDGDLDHIYEVIVYAVAGSGNARVNFQFNRDNGLNYGFEYFQGGSFIPYTAPSTWIQCCRDDAFMHGRYTIWAKTGGRRALHGITIGQSPIELRQTWGFWDNTSDNITSIQLVAGGLPTTTYNAGTRCVLRRLR